MGNKKPQDLQQKCRSCIIIFAICLAVTIVLLIWGFYAPPTGVIDGSVLKAGGLLFAFAALAVGSHAITLGYDLKFSKGDATININNNGDNDETAN